MINPYRACSCRDAGGKLLGKRCPELGTKDHGRWYFRYTPPSGADGKRRQIRSHGYATKAEAEDAIVDVLGDLRSGRHVTDRRTTLAEYLDRWLSHREPHLKPRTIESYREAFGLYWKPAVGHLRLADLTEDTLRDVHVQMRKLNRPAEQGDRNEMLRRLAAARATIPRLPGQRVRTAPLSETRIRRVSAPLVTALGACKALAVNPAAGLSGSAGRTKPLLWTEPRVAKWRRTGKKPAAVMVWTAAQTGAFLDAIAADRLYALYHLAVHTGMRRGEIARLDWSDTDLASWQIHVTGDVKTESSDRAVTITEDTVAVLESWQGRQLLESAHDGWQDSGRVFTREDGSPLRDGYISEHFELLVGKAGLPPIRFHDLRHGTASLLLAAGQPAKVVSDMLGHASVSFTMDVYTTVAEELTTAAVAALGKIIPRRVISESSES